MVEDLVNGKTVKLSDDEIIKGDDYVDENII
jgi:hypothetical protein